MSETKILVPYDEYTAMVKDSADLESIKGLLHTDFPDNTCQILAIKSVLGMVPEKEPIPENPNESEPIPEKPNESEPIPEKPNESEPIPEKPVENEGTKTEPEEGTV